MMSPVGLEGLGDNPPKATLHYGVHVLDALRQMESNSVQMVATSPPYWGLRDYGTEPQVWGGDVSCTHSWDTVLSECTKCGAWRGQLGLEPTPQLFVQHLVEVFREIRRVLRPDGVVWLNLGDTYAGYHGNARVPDEDAPSNKSGYVENMRKSNVGIAGLKPKDLVGIPWRVAFALQDDGWWLRSDVIWAKNACMPEAVTDRPTKAHEYVFLLTKAPRYFYDADAVREALSDTPAAASWRRIFDPAKQSKEIALKKIGCKGGNNGVRVFNPRGRNRRSVWTVNPRPYPGAHFATWPPKLVEIMVKAGSSEKGCCPTCGAPWNRVEYRETYREQAGVRKMSKTPLNVVRAGWRQRGPERRTTGWGSGCTCEPLPPRRCVVLDPFSGSATTGAVALRLGRDYIGIDLSKKYLPLAVARLEDRKPPVEVAAQETVDLIFELFGHPGDSR